MEEKQNWLSIAAVVLVIAGLGIFLYRQSQEQSPAVEAINEDQVAEDRAEDLLSAMNIELPENVERVNLKDVSGGQSAGIATRSDEDDVVTQSLLVALPEPEETQFYEAYLLSEDAEVEPTYLGKLSSVKGGWMLDYRLTEDTKSLTKVQVTRETTDDRQPEEVILEGAFEDIQTQESE